MRILSIVSQKSKLFLRKNSTDTSMFDPNKDIINDDTRTEELGMDTLKGNKGGKFKINNRTRALVRAAQEYYDNMYDLHKRWHRANDYVMGRQLDDEFIYNGRRMSTVQYLQMKGLPPMQNDFISDKMVALVSLVRQQNTTSIYKAIDERGQDIVALFNEMSRQNNNNNHRAQQDAELFRYYLCDGFPAKKVVYDFREGREDVWMDNVDKYNIAVPPFSNSDLSDVEFIAEAHDCTWGKILKDFARTDKDEDELRRIYQPLQSLGRDTGRRGTGLDQRDGHDDFLHSNTVGRYRVLEIWTLERRKALFVHDCLTGDCGYQPLANKMKLHDENVARWQQNIVRDADGEPLLDENGNRQYYIDPEKWRRENIIDFEPEVEEVWYVRFLTPDGHLLKESISPYKVLRNDYYYYYHPYIFLAYPCMQGEIRSMVMSLQDRQDAVNHYMVMLDFIIHNEAKGVLAVDMESVSDEQSWEEQVDQYAKIDGVILYSSKKGGNLPQSLKSNSNPATIDWMIKYSEQQIAQQSGVQQALQGAHIANTSGVQYRMERESAATTVSDYIETFNQFKLRVAKKQLWTMQCFYDNNRCVQITGEDFMTYYNKETMADVDLGVAIDLDTNSATIREKIDDLAFNIMKMNYITPAEMLQSGSFIGAEKLRRLLEKKEEQQQQLAAQQQAMGGNPAMSLYAPVQPAPETVGAPTVPETADHLKNEQPTGV